MKYLFSSARLCLLFFCTYLFTSPIHLFAQTPGYFKNGAGTGGNTIPWNTASQKTQLLYAPIDFSITPVAGSISKIYFRNSAAATSGTFTNLEVKFMQNMDLAIPSTSYYTTGFTSALSAASYSVTGNATAGGWFEILLTTPFPYDPTKSLIVEIQYSAKPTGGLSTTTFATTGRNTRVSGTSLTATTGTLNTTQNDFGMDILSSPCVSPPTAGSTTAFPSTFVCAGTTISLGLSGNSVGLGQTYQWQHSISSTGPFINIGTSSASTAYSFPINNDSFYRCEVVCNGILSYSVPIQIQVNTGLSGTYTINSTAPSSSTNFQTFTDAINAMSCGIVGPVIFNVDAASGPYNEQLIIPQITGASATNTITFKGNNRRIQATPVSATRAIIKLDGADHVIIDSLELVGLSATYGWGIHLTNGADSNHITNCTIDMSAVTSTTESNSACIVGSGSTTTVTTDGNANYNLIDHNTLIGAYKGIILNGATGALSSVKNIITYNTIRDFYQNGMEFTDNDSLRVKYNDISRTNRVDVTTMAGVELGSGNQNCIIDANKIHDTHNTATTQTGSAYGVFSTANDAPLGKENIVSNNLIFNFNSNAGIIYGLYNSGSDGVYYYHNTIVLDNQSAVSAVAYGFYQTTAATNIILKNNTIFVSRTGVGNRRCLHFNTATSVITSNYNNLYMASTGGTVNEVGYATTGYATLTTWQTGTTQDANSISIDPIFVSPANANFEPTAPASDNIGTAVGVLQDISGNIRSTTTPDIGAIEFNIPVCTSPPIAGNTLTDNATACKGQPFLLSFDNSTSTGIGQTYQWQVATSQFGVYSDIIGETGINATISQNDSNWYRVALTCSGLTSYTLPVQVITNPVGLPAALTIDTTIAVSTSNYHSLAGLAKELNCKGISGPTTITYAYHNTIANDSVSFIKIPGASDINTVTLIGKGNTIVSGTAPVVSFANTSYFIWDSMNVRLSATTGIAMHMTNQSQSITIRNSIIDAGKTATASTNAAIAISGLSSNATTVGNNGQFITIENNKIIGGYYGITMVGNAGYLNNNSQIIRNNTISDFYLYGIYLLHADTVLIEKNDLSRPTRTSISTLYGIYQGQSRFVKTYSNSIHNTGTADYSAYPIYITNSLNSSGYESEVINNAIYDIQTEGVFYGIYGLTTNFNNVKIYHNTIAYNTPAASTSAIRGVYIAVSPTNVDFKNNIISIIGAGTGIKTGIYIATTSATFTSNRNNIHVAATSGTGANNIGYWGAANTTLADWQVASSQDANSASTNPAFNSISNPTPLSLAIDNIGAPVGVLQDILSNTRSTTTPDIGAFEFNGIAGDMGIEGAEMLRSSVCYSSNDTLKVTVKNIFGTTVDFSIEPLSITWNVSGPVLSNGTILINTGTLIAGNSLTVFTNTVDRSTPGNYNYSVYISANAVNNITINDTLTGLTSIVKPIMVVSPKTATVTTPTQTVILNAKSALIQGSTPFFSEICHWRGATGAAPVSGWPAYLIADDYVEITGVPGFDLTGYTFEVWVGAAIQHTNTFTTGTLFSPNGTMIIATGQLGASVPSPANFYYHSGNTTTYGSTDVKGYILRYPNGTIVDATTYGAYTFPALSGVTPTDWSGTNPGVSSAGIRLIAPDNNTSSSWITESATERQDPNTVNPAVTAPSGTPLTGFDWNYLGSSFSSSPTVTVGPYTTPGIYTYVASFTNLCGTFYDTAYITASATVPVTLVQFSATSSKGNVVLNWSTASELNSNHFEIERSIDGLFFETQANVKAKGKSSTIVNYEHQDEKSFSATRNNTLYYRLKIVDNDGTFEHSKVARVSIRDSKEMTPFSIFPNPYIDKTHININVSKTVDAKISIVDITGKTVVTYVETVPEGFSTLVIQQSETLKTGIYFVSIEMNGEKQQAKLMKQ
jgi:hypothetical protein